MYRVTPSAVLIAQDTGDVCASKFVLVKCFSSFSIPNNGSIPPLLTFYDTEL